MSHCVNEFLKKVLNFRFKLDDIVPRYGSTIKSSFSGTVGNFDKNYVRLHWKNLMLNMPECG